MISASVAKPVVLSNRDAVSPPITNPTAQTVWKTGETQLVTWDIAALNGAPPSNPLAQIILGRLTPDGNEHLMFESPLVKEFPILGGNVSLTVPAVPSGENYIVCLFGSSGDISPPFTIVGVDPTTSLSSSQAPSPSSSAADPPASSTALGFSVTLSTTLTTVDPSSSPAPSFVASSGGTTVVPPLSSATAPSVSPSVSASAPGTTSSVAGAGASLPTGLSSSSAGAASGNATAAGAAAPSTTAPGTSGAQRVFDSLTVQSWGVSCTVALSLVLYFF
ncbi:hypothetical protein C8Q77DRAFT_1059822 [Trametes polyzona]|nr:hypothetical protein C8Q77DRAFT_1059822 [Trametes polyzona]